MLQYLEKLKQEDMTALVKKKDVQKTLMQDLGKANDVRMKQYLVVLRKLYVLLTKYIKF